MDKKQVIDAIKKNIVSIIAGVVALVAIGVMLFWINGKYDAIKKQTADRATKAATLTGLLGQERPNIQTSPGSSAEDQKLKVFPTPTVIKGGEEAMNQVKQQSARLLQEAVDVQGTRFVPLRQPSLEEAKKVWPLEGDGKQIPRDQFLREYQIRINAANNLVEGDYPAGSLQRDVGATLPPSADDIRIKQEALDGQLRAKEPMAGGKLVNPEGFEEKLAEAQTKLESQLKYERALNHLMYIDPNGAGTGFSVHPIASGRDRPTAKACFDAQIGLWVQSTVAFNLRRANLEALQGRPTDEQNLTQGPVKHLVSVIVPDSLTSQARIDQAPAGTTSGAGNGFNPGQFGGAPGAGEFNPYGGGASPYGPGASPYGGGASPYGPGGPAGAGTGDSSPVPTPAPANTTARRRGGAAPGADAGDAAAAPQLSIPVDAAAKIEPDYVYSVTGRPLHTPLYDLVQFNVTLRCEAAQVPYVLKQLQKDSLLTILNVDVSEVNLAVAAMNGYVYGQKPVVQLDLQCEMLFLRQWLAPLMPTEVRQSLLDWAGTEAAAE